MFLIPTQAAFIIIVTPLFNIYICFSINITSPKSLVQHAAQPACARAHPCSLSYPRLTAGPPGPNCHSLPLSPPLLSPSPRHTMSTGGNLRPSLASPAAYAPSRCPRVPGWPPCPRSVAPPTCPPRTRATADVSQVRPRLMMPPRPSIDHRHLNWRVPNARAIPPSPKPYH